MPTDHRRPVRPGPTQSNPVQPNPASPPNHHSIFRSLSICALLAVLTVATFWPALNCGFVNLDDNFYVVQNPRVATGLTLDNAAWVFKNAYYGNWAPLTLLSHMLDIQLFGLKPAGHHAINLFLHTLNVLLLFLLLRRMTVTTWPSAIVAALFAVHPTHVESVAWISERKDVLSGLFFMLTLFAYVEYVRIKSEVRNPKSETNPKFEGRAAKQSKPTKNMPGSGYFAVNYVCVYLLVLLLFALGLMSKSMLVTLPFVLLLLDYWPLRRMTIVVSRDEQQFDVRCFLPLAFEKLPFFILTILFTVISSHALKAANAIPSLGNLSIVQIASNAFIAYVRYIGKALWPLHLAAFYPRPEWPLWLALTSGLAILILSIAAVYLGRYRPYIPVGWFWFLGMLIPVTAVPLGDHSIADRYTYLSFIGLFIVLAWGAADIASHFHARQSRFIPIPGLALIVTLAVLSRNQVRYWRTSKDLFEHVIAVSGEGLMVHNDLGVTLLEQGDFPAAEEHFSAAARLEPSNAIARLNLIRVLTAEGKTNEVVTQYSDWLRLKPSDATARENLGMLLIQLGRNQEAIEQFETLIRLKPDAQSYYRLALAELIAGQPEQAINHYQEAIRLKPDWPEPPNDLAWLLATSSQAKLRNGSEAVQLAERACKLTQYKEARFLGTLDAAYAEAGRFPEAITTAERAKNLALAAGDKTIADLAEERLKLYRSGVPFHQQ